MQTFSKVRNLLKISRKSKNLENLKIFSREALLLYELSEREPGWRFTARCHTKTVAKPDRLGPAQNDKPMQIFVELSRFWWITLREVHRKPCRAYVEDEYGCVKMWKSQCQRRTIEVPDFRKFRKFRKNEKYEKIRIFKRYMERIRWDDEALYESSVRKLGWRFTARLPSTKTIAKRARVGPRTPVVLTMRMLF